MTRLYRRYGRDCARQSELTMLWMERSRALRIGNRHAKQFYRGVNPVTVCGTCSKVMGGKPGVVTRRHTAWHSRRFRRMHELYRRRRFKRW